MIYQQSHLSRRGFCLCCMAAASFTATSGWLSPREAYAEARGLVSLIKDSAAASLIKTYKLRNNISVLEGSGADLVSNGAEAVTAVRRRPFDVVLMDVRMPELDGPAATRLIRAELGDRGPWIIAVTADALPGARDACLAAGMDDYLTKPLVAADLARALARAGRYAVRLPVLDPDALDTLRELVGGDPAALSGAGGGVPDRDPAPGPGAADRGGRRRPRTRAPGRAHAQGPGRDLRGHGDGAPVPARRVAQRQPGPDMPRWWPRSPPSTSGSRSPCAGSPDPALADRLAAV